jgi:hypothetical protein
MTVPPGHCRHRYKANELEALLCLELQGLHQFHRYWDIISPISVSLCALLRWDRYIRVVYTLLICIHLHFMSCLNIRCRSIV